MVELDKLPTSKAEVLAIKPEFPKLVEDSPRGCPCSATEIARYLVAETGAKQDLFFGRTALVGDVRFWLWGYVSDGQAYYVDVSARGERSTICMGSGEGLTPEQYIALRYARRWKKRA